MVSEKESRNFGILGIMSPLIMAIGIGMGYVCSKIYDNFENSIINQNRPYMAQIRELNGDSIPDLKVYTKDKEYILIGQENGKFLSIDDIIEAKKDSLSSIKK